LACRTGNSIIVCDNWQLKPVGRQPLPNKSEAAGPLSGIHAPGGESDGLNLRYQTGAESVRRSGANDTAGLALGNRETIADDKARNSVAGPAFLRDVTVHATAKSGAVLRPRSDGRCRARDHHNRRPQRQGRSFRCNKQGLDCRAGPTKLAA